MSDPTYDSITSATTAALRNMVYDDLFLDNNLAPILKEGSQPLAYKRLRNMGVSPTRAREIVAEMKASGIPIEDADVKYTGGTALREFFTYDSKSILSKK